MENNTKIKRLATGIVQKLRRNGFAAYFVGGCVRDVAMRKTPKDFDIVTSARPQQIKKIFPKKTIALGEKFGTLLLVKEKIGFQISSFRGKKGNQSLSSLVDDTALRDFTINGLVYDPVRLKIIDLVGGREDIRKKMIRAIGGAAARFKEDPLRLIRAIRL
ncbi:MAG: CCA tRNA nucleotidyltransferase, partial [Omnitrophica bacterium]|nr:CCA tRNA nucleotidyltransferase [Candidatus Omnitrophota bacterium]